MGQQALPPFKNYRDAFGHLESAIGHARKFASLQKMLADLHEEGGTEEFVADVVKAMKFIADETFKAVDEAEDLWLHLHNSAPDRIKEEPQP